MTDYRFGLLRTEGPPSRSPELYQQLWAGHVHEAKLSYTALNLEARADWSAWLSNAHLEGWSGFNVTIPHKIDVWNSIPNRTPQAQAIGATNCVVRMDGGWQCHNTDSDGFWFSWESQWNGYRPKNRCAWVIGNGGAARAVTYALLERGFDVQVFARTPRPEFFQLIQRPMAETADAPVPDVVVNATSLGHGTQAGQVPDIHWPNLEGCWAVDAVYGPSPTPFQIRAAQAGARVLDGMPMLHMQAKKAWEYWSEVLIIPDF